MMKNQNSFNFISGNPQAKFEYSPNNNTYQNIELYQKQKKMYNNQNNFGYPNLNMFSISNANHNTIPPNNTNSYFSNVFLYS